MLTQTQYNVDPKLIQEAVDSLQSTDYRTTINEPTGNFFYDPWIVKDEFKNTVWAKLLDAIKEPIGEARIIILEPTKSYHAHADIDDRFHLNIKGEDSYLIDLEHNKVHKLQADGIWYDMDAGRRHTASNFGRFSRVQLVVRKLLNRNVLKNPKPVAIDSLLKSADDSRFVFDNKMSPWLNTANKQGTITDFSHDFAVAKFYVEEDQIPILKFLAGNDLNVHD